MNRSAATIEGFEAPSLALFAMEGVRSAIEYTRMRLLDRSGFARGDGHPVILFPGLAAGAETTGPLRDFCAELGYDVCDWGRGRNVGPQGDPHLWLDELADEVQSLIGRRGQPATLIGWSLGGFYAREIAKKAPSRVRQVITLATPFADGAEHTNVGWVYRWINGHKPILEAQLAARLRTPASVPATCIYSRTDGVVAWQSCLDAKPRANAENIEVDSSHCGMCWHPNVLTIVADRLAQSAGQWSPYREATGANGPVLPAAASAQRTGRLA